MGGWQWTECCIKAGTWDLGIFLALKFRIHQATCSSPRESRGLSDLGINLTLKGVIPVLNCERQLGLSTQREFKLDSKVVTHGIEKRRRSTLGRYSFPSSSRGFETVNAVSKCVTMKNMNLSEIARPGHILTKMIRAGRQTSCSRNKSLEESWTNRRPTPKP